MSKSKKQDPRTALETHFARRLGSTTKNGTTIRQIAKRECSQIGIEPTPQNLAAVAAALSNFDPRDFTEAKPPEPPASSGD